MRNPIRFYRTSIGKKVVVAVTGAVLFLFVVAHMLGNLKAFLGSSSDGVPEVDVYAHFLRTMGEPLVPFSVLLWMVRAILLACVVLHVVAAVQLAASNRAARPVPYVRRTFGESSAAARWMLWTGLLLLAFAVVHILHFTTGTINITPILDGQVYANLYHAFSVWYITVFYAVAMAFLAWHLYHGVWSLFQTLGLDSPDRNRMLRMLATLAAALLFVGFCAVPVSFWLGWLPAPTDVTQLPQQSLGAP